MNRKELKKKARENIKHNYIKTIMVCFIALILINGGYELFTEPVINSAEVVNKTVHAQIIDDVLNGMDNYIEASNKGVLAVFANSITKENNILLGTLSGFNQLIFHGTIAKASIIFIGVIISILFWLFISNIIEVGEKRYFIEKAKYKDTSADRLLYVYRNKKTLNTAKIMFLKDFYLFLWAPTIIGAFIKSYSYKMVPYLLAQNPDISSKDAFRLSKQIMNGQKWNAFKLDVSFIFYKILGILSFNIVNLLYTEPYYQMTYAYLYIDLLEKNNLIEKMPNITLEEVPKRKWLKIDYQKEYSIQSLILMFFTFAFIGWLWEVGLNLFMTGEFVNKGTLIGPYLPIYGFGGVLLIIFLKPLREKPILVFLLATFICAVIEYFTSVYLEYVYHMKWWDYSGFFLNINGRICLEGLILFGLGGCTGIYVVAPLLDNIYKKIPINIKTILLTFLIIVFIFDFIHSSIYPNNGKGITTSALKIVDININE